MDPLARIPTRWLLAGAAVACLVLWAAPSSAQTAPADPVEGRLLFNDTPNVDGVDSSIFNSCANCHTNVQNRRTKIAGSAFADIRYDTARDKFGSAIGRVAPMSQFQALSAEQVNDISAYIADTPKITGTGTDTTPLDALDFTASAAGVKVSKTLTVRHSLATDDNLQIKSVALATGGTTAFTAGTTCNNMTRAPAATCAFTVDFLPTAATDESRKLTVTLQQGGVTFTREVQLNGSVAAAPGSGGDGGGGALGWAWLTGLGLATAALARRKRA